jgi:uncharacterized coiled-coil DUF342 family protein
MQISKNRTRCAAALLVIGASLFYSATAQAQVRIYNKERDEQAKKTEKLVETIQNGALFEKQLKNLAVMSQRDFETSFLALKINMNAEPLALFTWGNALETVMQYGKRLSSERLLPETRTADAALDELMTAIAEAQASLDKLKAAANTAQEGQIETDPTLSSLFKSLGDFSDLIELAQKLGLNDSGHQPTSFTADAGKAIGQIKGIIGLLQKVYDEYATKVSEYNQQMRGLTEIRVALKKVALQNLQVDEAFWKRVSAIRARREAERAQVSDLITSFSGYASRLQLVKFEAGQVNCPSDAPCDLKLERRKAFINAINQALQKDNSLYPKGQQSISESLKEISERLKTLENANQEVLRQVKAALQKLSATASDSEFLAAADQTLSALGQALSRIESKDIVHQTEVTTSKQWGESITQLKTAKDATDRNGIEKELRNLIAQANFRFVELRSMAADAPLALLELGALIARGDTPDKMAELRLAQEAHAYSIRKSAVRARAYELTVTAGVKRLALYHQGGVKPETIAAFIHALSTAAIPPVILNQ